MACPIPQGGHNNSTEAYIILTTLIAIYLMQTIEGATKYAAYFL